MEESQSSHSHDFVTIGSPHYMDRSDEEMSTRNDSRSEADRTVSVTINFDLSCDVNGAITPTPKIPCQRTMVDLDKFIGNELEMSRSICVIPEALVPSSLSTQMRHDLQSNIGRSNLNSGGDSAWVRGDDDSIPVSSSSRRTYNECGEHSQQIRGLEIQRTYPGNESIESLTMPDMQIMNSTKRNRCRRQLLLWFSLWILCAVAVTFVSVTLARRYSSQASRKSPEATLMGRNDTSNSNTSQPRTILSSVSPSKSPINVAMPFTQSIDQPGTKISRHAASFSWISSCENVMNDMGSYNLILSCGGSIVIERYDNMYCNDSTIANEDGQIQCQLNKKGDYMDTISNKVYKQGSGLVLFSCHGTNRNDLSATAEFLAVTASNCTGTEGSIVTSITLGRFCQGDTLKLRDEFSTCEEGMPYSYLSSRKVLEDNKHSNLLVRSRGNSRHIMDSFNDTLETVISNTLDQMTIMCYDSATCSQQNVSSESCTLNTMAIRTGDSDLVGSCVDRSGTVNKSYIDNLWNMSQTILNPSKQIDTIVYEIL
jgi:hypothetical protein